MKLQGKEIKNFSMGFIFDFLKYKLYQRKLGPNLLYRIMFGNSYFIFEDSKKIQPLLGIDFEGNNYYKTFMENLNRIVFLIKAGKLTEDELAQVVFSDLNLFDVLESKGYIPGRIEGKDYFPISREEKRLALAT